MYPQFHFDNLPVLPKHDGKMPLAFVESREVRMGIGVALGFVGILSALTATVLIGFCSGDCSTECSCSPATGPLMATLGMIVGIISFGNTFYLSGRKHT